VLGEGGEKGQEIRGKINIADEADNPAGQLESSVAKDIFFSHLLLCGFCQPYSLLTTACIYVGKVHLWC